VISLLSDYRFRYLTNDDLIIAMEQKKDNQALYPKDEWIALVSKIYITYYYTAIYKLSKLVDIKPAFLLTQAFTRWLFFVSVFFLSLTLFRKHEVGWISMLILLTEKSLFGNSVTVSTESHPQFVSIAIVLLGITFVLKRKIAISAVIISLVLYLHAMSAIWGALYSAFCWIGIYKKGLIKRTLLPILLAVVVSIPFFYFLFDSEVVTYAVTWSRDKAEAYARWRIPIHIFPLTWGMRENLLNLTILSSMFFLAYIGVQKQKESRKILVCVVVGTLLMWACGTVFTELYYLSIMNKLQLFRASSIIVVVLSIYLANYVCEQIKDFKTQGKYSAIIVLLFGVLCISLNNLDKTFLIGIVAIFLAPLIDLPQVNQIFETMIRKTIQSLASYRLLGSSIICVVFVSFGALFAVEVEGRLATYYNSSSTLDEEFVEAALWSKDNTPIDSLFVTPPYAQGFRVWSERSQLPDWKDAGIGNYAPRFALISLDVMKGYGFQPGMDEKYLESITSETIITVGKKHGADYAILPMGKSTQLNCIEFMNKKWQIVALNKTCVVN